MPAIRTPTTQGHAASPFYNTFDPASVKGLSYLRANPRSLLHNVYPTSDDFRGFGPWTITPTDMFIVPPMVVPSQAAELANIPIGEYLAGISSTSSSDVETSKKVATPNKKPSKKGKGKSKSKENISASNSTQKNFSRIKKPMNAFMIFRSELSKASKSTEAASSSSALSPTAPTKVHQNEFSKEAARIWRELPLEKKRLYEEKAAKDKERVMRLQAQRERDAEDARTDFQYEYFWHTNVQAFQQGVPGTSFISNEKTDKQVEVIDLTDDYDEASSVQNVSYYNETNHQIGVDLAPRSYHTSSSNMGSSSPQLAIPQAPAPLPIVLPQLYMPTPNKPISASITQFAASIMESLTSTNSFDAYASSSISSSSSPNLEASTSSPISETQLMTPTSGDISCVEDLFGIEDFDWSPDGQTPVQAWLPSEMSLKDDVEVMVPNLDFQQWCWQ